MALRYLFDEHLRGTLPQVVVRQARRYGFLVEVEQVGAPPGLPLGTPDAELIHWAEANDWVLVSRDVRTLPVHLERHLAAGGHSPGIFIARGRLNVELAEWLVLMAFAANPEEYRDRVTFVP